MKRISLKIERQRDEKQIAQVWTWAKGLVVRVLTKILELKLELEQKVKGLSKNYVVDGEGGGFRAIGKHATTLAGGRGG